MFFIAYQNDRESVAGSVIQATGMVEFEDGLSPPWRLLVPLWQPHLAQDQFCTTGGVQQVVHEGGLVVIRTPVRPNSNSAEFHA